MKKFTKLFLSCAAVAAVTAAVATSAMAADVSGDLAGTYDEATGKLSLTTELSGTTTVLVLAPGTDSTAVAADDILYIDQVEDGVLGEMGVKGAPTAETAPGKYNVLVGSYVGEEFVVKTGTFKLGGSDVLIGDVNLDESVTLADATCIVLDFVGTTPITDEAAREAADCNGDEGVTLADATCIVQYFVGNYENAGNIEVAE